MQTTITIGDAQHPIALPSVEVSELFDWENLKVLAWNRRFVASALMSADAALSQDAAMALTGKLGAFGSGPGTLSDAVASVMAVANMTKPAAEDGTTQPAVVEVANA